MDLSFWEKNTWFSNVDILIVGSGIVGLSAALSIKLNRPDLKVLVADRGFLPYGASTRNAGFACFGSITELMSDMEKMTEEQVFGLLERRWNGLKRLRLLLNDDAINYEGLGGYEVFTKEDETIYNRCIGQLDYFNSKLKELTGEENVYSVADEKIADFAFKNVSHLLLNRLEGQIDTGKMMQSLLEKVRLLGVTVLNGIEIKSYNEENKCIYIETVNGFGFRVRKMLVTTNGFARQLLPQLQVVPARAQVLVTDPIPGLKIKGCFHYFQGYYYFRNVDNRLLFGGGRNLALHEEETWEFGLTNKIQNKLHDLIDSMILPGIKYSVDMRWSGIMGLGPLKTTIIERITEKIFCAVRMGGMGIAIGSLVGEEAAAMVCEME